MAPVPGWLAGFKLPGYKGETASKGDGVIADPATELDPSIKAGALVTPMPGPGIIETLITAATPDWLRNLVTDAVTMAGYGAGNATLNSGNGGADSSSANNSTIQSGKSDPGSTKVPSSILGGDGKLPAGIGGTGTPIPMEPTSNPSATAEQFAKAAFNGQTPVKVVNNITGEGSWVAIMPDGTAITYRPAGQASAATATTTATVEINSAAVRNINNGNVAKFKFPSK